MHFNRDELKGLPFTFPTTIHRYINAFHSQTEGIGIRIICESFVSLSNELYVFWPSSTFGL
jgi:hypothetical protein